MFGRKYPILSPKHEDFPLLVSPGVSGQLNGNVKRFELESNISENGSEFRNIYYLFSYYSIQNQSDFPQKHNGKW